MNTITGKIGWLLFGGEMTGRQGSARVTVRLVSPSTENDGHYCPAESVTMIVWQPEDIDAFVKTLLDLSRISRAGADRR